MNDISASDVYANRRRAVQQLQGTAQSSEPAISSEAPWTQASAEAIYAGRRSGEAAAGKRRVLPRV